jgi:hypothetical protein
VEERERAIALQEQIRQAITKAAEK